MASDLFDFCYPAVVQHGDCDENVGIKINTKLQCVDLM